MKEISFKKIKRDEIDYAFLATFLMIIGCLIVLISKKRTNYVMYYLKHSLVIFMIGVIIGLSKDLINKIPLGNLINIILIIIFAFLWSLSWMYSLTGKKKNIPLITDLVFRIFN